MPLPLNLKEAGQQGLPSGGLGRREQGREQGLAWMQRSIFSTGPGPQIWPRNLAQRSPRVAEESGGKQACSRHSKGADHLVDCCRIWFHPWVSVSLEPTHLALPTHVFRCGKSLLFGQWLKIARLGKYCLQLLPGESVWRTGLGGAGGQRGKRIQKNCNCHFVDIGEGSDGVLRQGVELWCIYADRRFFSPINLGVACVIITKAAF